MSRTGTTETFDFNSDIRRAIETQAGPKKLYLVRGRCGRRKSFMAGIQATSPTIACFLLEIQPGPPWTGLTAVEMWRCLYCAWPNEDMGATRCKVCRCTRTGCP